MQEPRVRLSVSSFAAIFVCIALSACISARHEPPASAAGVVPMGANPRVNVPGLSLSESDMLERMTDANILSRLCSTDSLEIEMAKVARDHASSDGIRDFARRLIADHSMSLEHDRLISTHQNLAIQVMPGDTSALMAFRLLDTLRAIPAGAQFDRRYLTSQIGMHEHLLAQLQTLQHVARDKALHEHVDDLVLVVQHHLTEAQTLARGAGFVGTGS